jgi:hypothetical protein
MGIHGPTCIFWANLTPFSLELRDMSVLPKCDADACIDMVKACEDYHKVSFSNHLGRHGECQCQCMTVRLNSRSLRAP